MDYVDFEVEIGDRLRTGKGPAYPVAVKSPLGEQTGALELPFAEKALRDQLDRVAVAVGLSQTRATPQVQIVQAFGNAFFRALLRGNLLDAYDKCVEEAKRENPPRGVRLKLHVLANELVEIPWEFLYDHRRREYLSRTRTLVRYITPTHPIVLATVPPPVRILGLVAWAGNRRVDLTADQRQIETALRSFVDRKLVHLEWMERETVEELHTTLVHAGPWHVFYFVGHGRYDREKRQGTLMLADKDGFRQSLGAQMLGELLGAHSSMRLAVLNSCEGAKGEGMSSVAAELVQHGVPAVVAMQYPISNQGALHFSERFYTSIFRGLPIDQALSEARTEMSYADEDSVEFGTPVLYTSVADGLLFDLKDAEVETRGSTLGGQPSDAPAPMSPDPVAQKHAPATHVVGGEPGGYSSIAVAVRQAADGDRVIVRPGVYEEQITVDRAVEIVGDTNAGEVLIQLEGPSVMLWRAASGGIANVTIKHTGVRSGVGIDVAAGTVRIDNCNVSSQGEACVRVRGQAAPELRRNRIAHGSIAGIIYQEQAGGLVEDNEIFGHGSFGIDISTRATPTLQCNRIHDNEGGVFVHSNGLAVLEENDIANNTYSGIEIRTGGNPVVRHNTIHHNSDGVFVHEQGLGLLEDNSISSNLLSGVEIRTGSSPQLRRNTITNNGGQGCYVHDAGGGVIEDNDLRGNRQGAWNISGVSKSRLTRNGNLE